MAQAPEYSRIRSRVEKQEAAFRALLNDETTAHFEKFLAERNQLDFIYEQALFRSGFQVALELFR